MPTGVYKRTEYHKNKISNAMKGKMPKNWHPKIGFKKGNTINVGVPWTVESRKKLATSKSGEKSNLWKGGVTKKNLIIRASLEYRLWRESVFKRDNFTCIWCGAKSGNGKKVVLNADHIKPFSLYPELRFAIDNGRTLCVDCHKTTDTYGSKIKYYK